MAKNRRAVSANKLMNLEVPSGIINRVEAKVHETYLRAQALYGRSFKKPSIEYNIWGRTAGLAYHAKNRIRLNPVLLRENAIDFVGQIVPHEIAHLLTRAMHGTSVKSHGPDWKSVMLDLGLQPRRCHNYHVKNTTMRQQRSYPYLCHCCEHSVSQTIHNRICRGRNTRAAIAAPIWSANRKPAELESIWERLHRRETSSLRWALRTSLQ